MKKFKKNQSRGWDMLDDSKVLEPISKNVNKRIGDKVDNNIKKWAAEPIVLNIG